jgi:hypothetical protein
MIIGLYFYINGDISSYFSPLHPSNTIRASPPAVSIRIPIALLRCRLNVGFTNCSITYPATPYWLKTGAALRALSNGLPLAMAGQSTPEMSTGSAFETPELNGATTRHLSQIGIYLSLSLVQRRLHPLPLSPIIAMDRPWVNYHKATKFAKYGILTPPKATVPRVFTVSVCVTCTRRG